mgnify:CR=1 FL=1
MSAILSAKTLAMLNLLYEVYTDKSHVFLY